MTHINVKFIILKSIIYALNEEYIFSALVLAIDNTLK